MNKLEQAVGQALSVINGMDQYHGNLWKVNASPEELDELCTALREALAHPKQDLDPAARNGWVLREVLFDNGEPVGYREPQSAAAEQEPVAYLYCGGQYGGELDEWEIDPEQHQCDKLNEQFGALGKEARIPLYTAPQPARRPLADEQIDNMVAASLAERDMFRRFARAIERAHGIGCET